MNEWIAVLIRVLCFRSNSLLSRLRSAYWTALIRRDGGSMGRGIQVRKGAHLEWGPGSRLEIGNEVIVAEGAAIYVGAGARLTLGDRVFIGRDAVIVANQELSIGAGTQLAHHVTVIDTDHRFGDPTRELVQQGAESAPIRIAEEVWIGAQAVVLKGRTIGARAVIGAGAIVTRDVSASAVAVGNPARELPERVT